MIYLSSKPIKSNPLLLSQKFCYEPKRYPRLQVQQQRSAVPRSTAGGGEEEEETPVVRISMVAEPVVGAAAAQDGVRRDIR